MLCVSVQQPWASLMAHGFKRVKAAGSRTRHRGPMGIYACRVKGDASRLAMIDPDIRAALKAIGLPHDFLRPDGFHDDMPLGCVVAVGNLVDVVHREDAARHLVRDQLRYGDYAPGEWLWVFEGIQRLDPPVPARGNVALFSADLSSASPPQQKP